LTTIQGDGYKIAINPITKEEYKIYDNGTVFDCNEIVITEDGFEGLVIYLQQYLQQRRTVEANYTIATDPYTGDEYFVFKNGSVTSADGTWVTDGGVSGLT